MEAATAAIDRLVATMSPYSVILPKLAELGAAHGIPYATLKTYLEDKYIELIRGKARQKEILERYGLPLVYINQLIAKAAAPAAEEAAAALTLAGFKGSKGGVRRKTGMSHFSSKRRSRSRRRRSTRRRR
jgi:hypothetical protein